MESCACGQFRVQEGQVEMKWAGDAGEGQRQGQGQGQGGTYAKGDVQGML